MEVDADWDIDLKNQLTLFAQGSQYITKGEGETQPFNVMLIDPHLSCKSINVEKVFLAIRSMLQWLPI